ncbi:Metallo-dependent phosphatase-like protein [Phyllosticta citricarpa]
MLLSLVTFAMVVKLAFPVFFATVVLSAQPSAPSPKAAPIRELPWGQLNFLHTTDTHGWLGGHLQESSYSADWGDYISFAKHLKERADSEGVDLVTVDTGDRIEGNGLYDASEPKGKYIFDIFKQQSIDVICSGNHELYQRNSSENEFNHTIPNFKDSYLASNLDIQNPKTGKFEPLAPRFKKFTTKNKGIRILAFGFLFNFAGNANNTIVTPVEDAVKQKWFQEAIRDKDVDLILVAGHAPVRSQEFSHIFKTIRSVNWDIPIQFFGGHAHVRDYKKFDENSVALASGRYMETIGFQSIDGLNGGGKSDVVPQAKLSFARRYIDNNLFSLHHHSGMNSSNFATEHGKNVTKMITKAREELKLDRRHGCAPKTLWVNRAPYPANNSIFSWLEKRVLPDELTSASRIAEGKKAIVITNTGALRFDIFEGPFTRDSTYLVSPFTSGFRYVSDVAYSDAKKVLQLLNNEGRILEIASAGALDAASLAPPEQWSGRLRIANEDAVVSHVQHDGLQAPLGGSDDKPSRTPGYTTVDDAGNDGDDTIHSQIEFFDVPNCIQASIGFNETAEDKPKEVDLVYNEFVQPWILLALRYLGEEYNITDTKPYMEGRSLTSMLTNWITENWSSDEEVCSTQD